MRDSSNDRAISHQFTRIRLLEDATTESTKDTENTEARPSKKNPYALVFSVLSVSSVLSVVCGALARKAPDRTP